MIKIKKDVKIVKQAGMKKPVKPVKQAGMKKPVKVEKPVKLAAFISFIDAKILIPELKKPDYDKIRAKNTDKFTVRLSAKAQGAIRLLTAYYAGAFKKPGIFDSLECKEIKNSLNYSDRMILLALGKIANHPGGDLKAIKASAVEYTPGSENRKAIKIRIV